MVVKQNIDINQVPSITWTWLKMNSDQISLEKFFEQSKPYIDTNKIPDGIEIVEVNGVVQNILNPVSGVFNVSNSKALDNSSAVTGELSDNEQTKLNSNQKIHSAIDLIQKTKPDVQYINITSKSTEPLILYFNNKEEAKSNATVSLQVITAEQDTEATIIFVYENAANQSIIQTKVIAKENAKLHLIKVQLLPERKTQLDDTIFECYENSQTKFTQIELGGSHIDSGLNVYLKGYKSVFESNVAYTCQKNQFLDMNHIVNHYGKKSECKMNVNGTVKDDATKTYRGTIDFKNGCSGSKGNEMEETLLLSPTAVNKSLPVILCDEEDVEGEHGSTIGRISQDILFYMQTRGISKAQAEKLMTRAKVQAVADLIPSEEVKEKINNFFE